MADGSTFLNQSMLSGKLEAGLAVEQQYPHGLLGVAQSILVVEQTFPFAVEQKEKTDSCSDTAV
eukprot:2796525-Prorocentrum_lima.AAC.1